MTAIDFAAISRHVQQEVNAWRKTMAGEWPPSKITKELATVAKALCRSGCQPGLWQTDEIEKHVRKNWKRHLWSAAVALHAIRSR